jgi:predicted O-linked N-acetylglucosamine transferase (SPINDLY family)
MLTYQNGSNDRDFLKTVSKLVHPHLEVSPTNEEIKINSKQTPVNNANEKRLPRVGFFFDNTEKNTVAFIHYFNIVKNCHKSGIEVVIIKGPMAAKQNSSELEAQSSSVVQLYSNLEQSVKTLRRLNLQMLIYTEIHSSPAPYCLAHNRIAPIQAVFPGNLITTGISTIDYFISSEYMETSNSHDQYTEQLIKLKAMPWGITQISKIAQKKGRDYFDLPEKSRIFGLLYNLIKFHPDWDELLEKIAQKSNETTFVLTGKGSKPCILLKKRWRENAPTFLAKCKFFDQMPKEDYLNLLGCTDAVLDPIHMGGGTTSIDALSMGIPIITKAEDHPRTRIVYGLYQIMGIKNAPIAYTNSDYVTYCTEILNNPKQYNELKTSINANFHKVTAASRQSINQITEEIKRLITA